jgi:hypothetical protein
MQVRFKLSRRRLDEIPQFAVVPEHFRLLEVRYKHPLLFAPKPAVVTLEFLAHTMKNPHPDNNVLVLMRDAARLAHEPMDDRRRGYLQYEDHEPQRISWLQEKGKRESNIDAS